MTERFAKGWVKLGASEKSSALYLGGSYVMPVGDRTWYQEGRPTLGFPPCTAPPGWEGGYSTWSGDKDRLLGGGCPVAGTHHVMAEDPEIVAIANDELGHHTVGAAIMLQDSEPFLGDRRQGRDLWVPPARGLLGTPGVSTPTVEGARSAEGG